MRDTFEALTNTATKVGTRAKVGDGSKITWWEQQKIHMHKHL